MPHLTSSDAEPVPSPLKQQPEGHGMADTAGSSLGHESEGSHTKRTNGIHSDPGSLYPTPPPSDAFPNFEPTAARDETKHGASDKLTGLVEANGEGEKNNRLSGKFHLRNVNNESSSSAIEDLPNTSAPTDNSNNESAIEPPRSRTQSGSKGDSHGGGVRKLSASQMQALASSPESLPIAIMPPNTILNGNRKPSGEDYPLSAGIAESFSRTSMAEQLQSDELGGLRIQSAMPTPSGRHLGEGKPSHLLPEPASAGAYRSPPELKRPSTTARTLSTPPIDRLPSPSTPSNDTGDNRRYSANPLARPAPLNLGSGSNMRPAAHRSSSSSSHRGSDIDGLDREQLSPLPPVHSSVPLPPMSLHSHLQLELASGRPSPLYIHRQENADVPYESSAIKFERLLNAFLLAPYLEAALTFGALACLDAFLYTFTLLPLRFAIALGVLFKWWTHVLWKESTWVVGYVWQGSWRVWERGRRGRTTSRASHAQDDGSQTPSEADASRSAPESAVASPALGSAAMNGNGGAHPPKHHVSRGSFMRHRRTRSMPSNLTSFHKADLLQGAVIICSSLALMHIDASRMYHFIRAQSAMKLYVIYNLLEVGDRLLGAIGQDILECLFSSETLSRNSSGRSKLLLPFGMFILSAIYNVIHAVCLFYQVITLNVAVNSYSNALMTLILSNQFVEIKGSVFKKIEKENLFQLTASDVVERFQLWVILVIIGMRNIVEVGGLSVPGAGSEADGLPPGSGPRYNAAILPDSFNLLPSWLMSGEVLSPFLVVIGSEMLVDWIKHAYVNKFNNVKPAIYKRMLDIFCKDYYTSAFGTPALTRRIGLPVLPLSCLFIRASVQIYHMFLATHVPLPMPTSTTVSLEESTPTSPAVTAALERLDSLIRNALGRAVYGLPLGPDADVAEDRPWWKWTGDDVIAMLTMAIFFFMAWVALLALKLMLGMALLRYSRDRYAAYKMNSEKSPTKSPIRGTAPQQHQEKAESYYQAGKRVGGWGHIEVGDERRRMLYADDPEGLKRMRDRERKGEEAARKMNAELDGLEKVNRYEMIAKRIW